MAEVQLVGVVGCGLMGSGIAQIAAQSGYEVIVREVNQELLDAGMKRIKAVLDKDLAKGKISQDEYNATWGRLHPTLEIEAFADADLVIEAIVEQVAAKRELFAALDRICKPQTILATNTSSLPVTEVAAATQRPDRVAGLHFFNPVPVMKLVELVRALSTSQETLFTLQQFGERLGKTVVQAQDTPGFIVNRLLIPYMLDAIRCYAEGLASREDIDEGMKLGAGHPMGPLTLADFVGLDTLYYVANVLFDEYKESRFAPPPLLRRMVLAGMLGKKSGKGFYDYN
ncbi:MAG: 3-hydroxybutyryl-CoA dehydrogenase [Candidatus Chloroheliales bacterium]|nr:MAG: 3-hydroxybutyryl-CoA dehydrogenase [Chloroflexota bacterium]